MLHSLILYCAVLYCTVVIFPKIITREVEIINVAPFNVTRLCFL